MSMEFQTGLTSEQFSPEYAQENLDYMMEVIGAVSDAIGVSNEEFNIRNRGQFINILKEDGDIVYEHLGPADGRELPSQGYLFSTNKSPYPNSMGQGEDGKLPKNAKTISDFIQEVEASGNQQIIGISQGEYSEPKFSVGGFAPPRPNIDGHVDSGAVSFEYLEGDDWDSNYASVQLEFGPNTYPFPEPSLLSRMKRRISDKSAEEIEKSRRITEEPELTGSVDTNMDFESEISEALQDLGFETGV